MGLSNPKALVFLVAFLPQLMQRAPAAAAVPAVADPRRHVGALELARERAVASASQPVIHRLGRIRAMGT